MKRFGQGADLVDLDQDGVGDPALYSLFETSDIGDEKVVADKLNLAPEPVGQQLPTIPVVFGHAVLDADDRVSADPSLVKVDELQRGERHALARAAARATASETPRIAFAPNRDLSTVPSSPIRTASKAAWSAMSIPLTWTAIVFSTLLTAWRTPLPP